MSFDISDMVYTAKRKISNYLSPSTDGAWSSVSTEPLPDDKIGSKSYIADWGTSNNFPLELDDKIKFSENFETGFQDLTEMTYALGLTTYKRVLDEEKGVWKIVPWYFPEFDAFVKSYSFNEEYLEKAIYSFYRYANTFVEFVVDKDGKVLRLFVQDAPFCRVSTLNPQTGVSDWAFTFANWKKYRLATESTIDTLLKDSKKLLNRIRMINRKDPINFIKNNASKYTNMLWHIKDYSPGDVYYGKSPWYPILDNGWLDLSKSLPSAIKNSYANEMSISKHVEYDLKYFEDNIPNYKNLGKSEQKKAKEAFQKSIEDHLIGEGNENKVVFTPFQYINGDKKSAIIINDIKNTSKNNTSINDSYHLNATIKNALRMDDSLTNSKNTGSKEADSGSEKKQASNLLQLRVQLLRDKLIYPMEMIKQLNNWDKDMIFGFNSQMMVSTDIAKTGSVQTTTAK